MKFWKDPAHIRTLLLYLAAGGAVSGLCWYMDAEWGLVVAVVCVMFTVFRLVGDMVHHGRVRAVCRRAERALRGDGKPEMWDERRGALALLDGEVYKLALALYDEKAAHARDEAASRALLRSLSAHLIARAEELPANVHRREVVALAHDMERLAALEEAPISPEEIAPTAASQVWGDALVLAGETLRARQVTATLEASPRAYVTTCPKSLVVGGLCGLLEATARRSRPGGAWVCSARETPVFVEFAITSPDLEMTAQECAAFFGGVGAVTGAEPALVYLSRLAELYGGEVRAQSEDDACRVMLRLYKSTR